MRRLRRAWFAVVLVAALAAWSGGATAKVAWAPAAVADKLAPEVRLALERGETVDAVVFLRPQADLGAVVASTRAARIENVVTSLRQTAERTQEDIRAYVESRRSEGLVARVEYLWIVNGLALTAHPDVIREVAARPEVLRITPNETLRAPLPDPIAPQTITEPNIALVGAPELWEQGFRGQGTVVATMDTGVDVGHPDLSAQWRGGTNSWFDPSGEHPTTPFDASGHGTKTMGILVGREGGGTAIGMAPDAQWIAVKIFNDAGVATVARIHQGFQWLLDPDGNPATPDAPHVVSGSWGFSSAGCNLEFQLDLQSLRATGILPVFAAGNLGPGPTTGISPGNYPEAFAVGATSNADVIYPASSRGPSSCGEPPTTFPDLVAPGVSVRTTDLFGAYRSATGTSFATPHVAGALALLLSAHPGLSLADQESRLLAGAVDLGAPGTDDIFGGGRLDVSQEALPPELDFTLSAQPPAASAAQGASAAYTVTVGPLGGFAGDVALSATGVPPGATATFAPSTVPAGSGSSQLTVATTSSTPTGSSTLTVTGTSGALVHSVAVTLTVTSAGATVFPSAVAISAGTLRGGGAADLTAADARYFEVDSTLWSTRRTSWSGTFTSVPNALTGLRLTYAGRNSVTCAQVVEIRRFNGGGWVRLDARDVGPTEVVLADLVAPGSPADYVSGSSGNGNVQVRVACSTRTAPFLASANLLRIAYNTP